MAPIMIIVAPLTPRLSDALRRATAWSPSAWCGIAFGLLHVRRALACTRRTGTCSLAIVPLVTGIALSMSPMTAAIMSAVPPRRAGAGSAMNDATRELGAALGIAVLGSLAASRYTSVLAGITARLPLAVQHKSAISLADALAAAAKLGGPAGHALGTGAQHAFIDGIRLAVIAGAALCAIAGVFVSRCLPTQATHGGDLESAPVPASTEALPDAGAAAAPKVLAQQTESR